MSRQLRPRWPAGPSWARLDYTDKASRRNLVSIELRLGGTLSPFLSEDGQAVDFTTPQGAKVIHYAWLAVRDAHGAQLPACMEGLDRGSMADRAF